jgi:hypothetical protein
VGDGAYPLVDLIGGEGLPASESVLPEDRIGPGGGGHAEEEVVDGGNASGAHDFQNK